MRRKLGAYLSLGRVSNLPTVWSNVVAGILLASGPLEPGLTALLCAACSAFYVGGMFLNDAFDQAFDARVRPERPIPSGRVTSREVYAVGFGLLAIGELLLMGRSLASGAALAGAIVLYDAWHKRNPIAPLLMGLCRVLVYVTAAFAVSASLNAKVLGGAGVLLSYLIGLTFVARQENLKQLNHLWPLVFLVAPFVYCAPALGQPWVAAFYLGFLGWVGFTVSPLVRKGKAQIGTAVVQFIAGISLLDALLIASAPSGSLSAAAVAALGFPMTLLLQRYVKGT